MAEPFSQAVLSRRAAIALGANLGDPAEAFRSALAMLDDAGGVRVDRVSSFIESEAVTPDPADAASAPRYLNGAAVLTTELDPHGLLDLLLRVESAHGRDRAAEGRWGPRTLDLDLLLMGDPGPDGIEPADASPAVVTDGPRLTLPHPRMAERPFVLDPLAEVAPGWWGRASAAMRAG